MPRKPGVSFFPLIIMMEEMGELMGKVGGGAGRGAAGILWLAGQE